jgi:hypothetical protein
MKKVLAVAFLTFTLAGGAVAIPAFDTAPARAGCSGNDC